MEIEIFRVEGNDAGITAHVRVDVNGVQHEFSVAAGDAESIKQRVLNVVNRIIARHNEVNDLVGRYVVDHGTKTLKKIEALGDKDGNNME
ncbi:MAG: hypothetical protein QXT45_04255 [Candidatus Bilamarchaeaceae archaeon]